MLRNKFKSVERICGFRKCKEKFIARQSNHFFCCAKHGNAERKRRFHEKKRDSGYFFKKKEEMMKARICSQCEEKFRPKSVYAWNREICYKKECRNKRKALWKREWDQRSVGRVQEKREIWKRKYWSKEEDRLLLRLARKKSLHAIAREAHFPRSKNALYIRGGRLGIQFMKHDVGKLSLSMLEEEYKIPKHLLRALVRLGLLDAVKQRWSYEISLSELKKIVGENKEKVPFCYSKGEGVWFCQDCNRTYDRGRVIAYEKSNVRSCFECGKFLKYVPGERDEMDALKKFKAWFWRLPEDEREKWRRDLVGKRHEGEIRGKFV